jgi:hypothetical protein
MDDVIIFSGFINWLVWWMFIVYGAAVLRRFFRRLAGKRDRDHDDRNHFFA